MKPLASGVALLVLAVPAHAQNTADPRWSRWTGCWELVMENSREGAPSPDTAGRTTAIATARRRTATGLRRDITGMAAPHSRTKVGTQTPIVQTVVADGTDRPITEDGCTGTQRAEWSADGLRLYARAELTCKGDQGTRRVSGLAMLGPNGRWTDVQSVDIGGRESFRVRQYRRADDARTVPGIAATALTLDDVKEASAKVSPRALEAALVETRASFDLTSKRLLELQAAGVPASVVDLDGGVVVSRSVRHRADGIRSIAPTRRSSTIHSCSAGPSVFRCGQTCMASTHRSTVPYSPYYYSPFAYPYDRGYNPFYFGGGGYAIDAGGGGGGGVNVPDRPSGQGRVVDGQGYTRVRPRDERTCSLDSKWRLDREFERRRRRLQPRRPRAVRVAAARLRPGFSSGGGGGSDGGRTAQPR